MPELDPWGNRYRFCRGLWDPDAFEAFPTVPFVAYKTSSGDTPPQQIAAPPDLPVYIFSLGKDGVASQPYAGDYDPLAPGDDLGSWVQ